jgi:hypothetical protein
MARFVQIIEFTTSRIDEIRALGEDMRTRREAAGESGGPLRAVFTEDRDRSGHYVNVIEFESYESAMANSNHPETQEFARRMSELIDGPPTFYNLEVMDAWDRSPVA